MERSEAVQKLDDALMALVMAMIFNGEDMTLQQAASRLNDIRNTLILGIDIQIIELAEAQV